MCVRRLPRFLSTKDAPEGNLRPNMSRSPLFVSTPPPHLHGFDLFLSHLSSQIGQIFKALSALRGAKVAQHGLKMGSFHLFVHLK